MATKADFSEEEWKALQKGPTGAGMLASISDADFTESFGEAKTLAKYLGAQRDQGETPLMREIAHVHGSGFGLTGSPEKVRNETMEALRTATATLEAKAPDDLAAYRKLVIGAAEAVAAAKSGVSADEQAAIDELKQAVGGE
jgi:hypothetical protein